MKMPRPLKDQRFSRGFTLMEIAIAITFSMAIASIGLTLINQQAQLMRIFKNQEFILEEAPTINRCINSLLSKADAIRLHTSFSDAISDANPVTTAGTVLVAAYKNPDNTRSFGIIALEPNSDGAALNYYYYDPTGTAPVAGSAEWSISNKVNNASFALIDGLFQIRLTGPNSEVITYTISPDQ